MLLDKRSQGADSRCVQRDRGQDRVDHWAHVIVRTHQMPSLATVLRRGNNSFDLIRLLAALLVMFGHSFGIKGGGNLEWMLWLTHRESFGSVAVYVFFLISGMLVSASYVKQASAGRFTLLRAARIWPGAIVCALLIGLVIAPIFSVLPFSVYVTNGDTLRWLVYNTSLIGPVGGMLPGVFPQNHAAALVNATAWTLPVELECYAIVLLLGMLGLLESRRGMLLAIVVLGVVFFHFAGHPPAHLSLGKFFTLPIAYSFYPVPFFLLGMLLYTFRNSVRIHGLPAAALLIAYAIGRDSRMGAWLLYPAIAYGLLWLASWPRLFGLRPRHDYSYGIYLYGFVVQQALTALFPAWSNFLNVAVAIPIAACFAALSWHLVEKPVLTQAHRWVRQRNGDVDLELRESAVSVA